MTEERRQEELGETGEKASQDEGTEREMESDASEGAVAEEEATGGALPDDKQQGAEKPK